MYLSIKWSHNYFTNREVKLNKQFFTMVINTPEEVMAAEQLPGAVFLDVRGDEEVQAESLQARPFKHVKCSLDDCLELMSKAETLMTDKNGEIVTKKFWFDISHVI